MNLIETTITLLCDAIPDVVAIYLFGSFERGDQHAESDVDVAVLGPVSLGPTKVFDVAQQLAAVVHRDVDLLDLRSAATVMRMQVVSTGRCVYRCDEMKLQAFEMLVYSSYARLNEERREILKDIAARGSVYG